MKLYLWRTKSFSTARTEVSLSVVSSASYPMQRHNREKLWVQPSNAYIQTVGCHGLPGTQAFACLSPPLLNWNSNSQVHKRSNNYSVRENIENNHLCAKISLFSLTKTTPLWDTNWCRFAKQLHSLAKPNQITTKKVGWNILFYVEEQSTENITKSQTDGETIQLSILIQNTEFNCHLCTHISDPEPKQCFMQTLCYL